MEDKLKKAFSVALNIPADKVTFDLKYQSIPQWDSISHMVLVSEVERAFNISLGIEDVLDMVSFEKA